MIRIITGYSNTGGSTVALINLTNALNSAGYETIMYGPHPWHLDKCKSELIEGNKFRFNKNDTLLFHFKQLKSRPPAKKVILVCHEKWWFKVGEIPQYWDTCVFLHDNHRKYHEKYKGKYVIIPNLKEKLIKRNKSHLDKIAGIIGTIEDRKKTDISIKRALDDGCEKILIFGNIGDPNYFNLKIYPYLSDKIVMCGFENNKQKIYDQIGRVYHSSIGEVASLVKDECYSTGTKFFGNEETENEISTLSNNEIINCWCNILDIKQELTTFIVCHDQDIILKCEYEGKFKHINYKWIFVGNKDSSKISNLNNVYIARNLPFNIEDKKNLCSFTAWYAITKNKLCNTNYVAVLEYDCDISSDFQDKVIGHLRNMNNKGSLGFLNSLIDHPIYFNATPYFPSNVEKIYNINVRKIIDNYKYQNRYWNSGSNNAMSLDYLNGFVDWAMPILTMNVDDPLIAHVHERLVRLYDIINNAESQVDQSILKHHQDISHGIKSLWKP